MSGGPEMFGDIAELRRFGATQRYIGPAPGEFRARGLPNSTSGRDFIINKLRRYFSEVKMFACPAGGVSGEQRFFFPPPPPPAHPPSTAVAKKLHVGTLSSGKHPIWDGRRVDLRYPKTDYWPLITPAIHTLDTRFCQLGSGYANVPVVGAKRGADSALTRCRLHPDDAAMFGAEFELGPTPAGNITIFYSVLPFVFTGPPGIFGGIAQGEQRYRRLHTPQLPMWGGQEHFAADVFVGDGAFIEARIGERAEISASVFGTGADLFLGR